MASVEDRLEIEDLHGRYVHAIDRGDLDLLRSLYTDDAVERHGDYSGGVDGFVAWLRPVLAAFEIATHTISNLISHVDGDAAQSEARGVAFLRLKGEPPASLMVVNRHFDRYRRTGGRWLFASRSVCVDWAELFPPRSGPLELVAAFPPGSSGPGDPVYREAPDLVRALRARLPNVG